jgi:hypothetical protein
MCSYGLFRRGRLDWCLVSRRLCCGSLGWYLVSRCLFSRGRLSCCIFSCRLFSHRLVSRCFDNDGRVDCGFLSHGLIGAGRHRGGVIGHCWASHCWVGYCLVSY